MIGNNKAYLNKFYARMIQLKIKHEQLNSPNFIRYFQK